MPAKLTTGWSLETYVAHNESMRVLEGRLREEIDRRYKDVDTEREKAVAIKEKADAQALQLARDIQTYKDTQHNKLREQIESERGTYATKDDIRALGEKFDISHKPVVEFMAQQTGKGTGMANVGQVIAWVFSAIMALIAIGSFVFRAQTATPPAPIVIAVPTPSPTTTTTTK